MVPWGIAEFPVTSLEQMRVEDASERFDLALRHGLDAFLLSLEGGSKEA